MDRRVIWAILLMMVIAIGPSFFLKPPKRPVPSAADTTAAGGPDQPAAAPAPAPAAGMGGAAAGPAAVAAVPVETVTVASPLYRYAFSTRGAGMVQAILERYQALDPEERGTPVRILPDGGAVHQLGLTVGADTLWLSDWDFTPSAGAVTVEGNETLRFTAARGGVTVALAYQFRADDYQIGVTGQVTGLGPVGGYLVVGMGRGLRQTETDSAGNHYAAGLVTKTDESEVTPFADLKAGETTTLDGPFEWVAIKSKYFTTALLATDSGSVPISGVVARGRPGGKQVTSADVTIGIPVPAAGGFSYRLYAGPMEYPRLHAIGHDFYDINPYGWPGFRTIIRPVAVGARWLLVWMHEHLALPYGAVLIAFGILIRLVLWPLNQRGMRAGLRMQAVQPELQRLQEQYKSDPQRMQQEVMSLYRREGVNPFSGCWPMLLPWPVLLALFFVLSNTIELRGQSYLWLPDLSLKDPLYIIPILMGVSMYGVSKVGMRGMPPNPQATMMLYVMPVMMTVLFLNFASGLNLYYFVQNVVSIPQQWLLSQERIRARGAVPPPPPPAAGKKKRG